MQKNKKIFLILALLILVIVACILIPKLRQRFIPVDDTINAESSPNRVARIFSSLSGKQTLDSVSSAYNTECKLEDPFNSKTKYIWDIEDGIRIIGISKNKNDIEFLELQAPDENFYCPFVKFDDENVNKLLGDCLCGITKYEDVVKSVGAKGFPYVFDDGVPIKYNWCDGEYSLKCEFDNEEAMTSITRNPV